MNFGACEPVQNMKERIMRVNLLGHPSTFEPSRLLLDGAVTLACSFNSCDYGALLNRSRPAAGGILLAGAAPRKIYALPR